ncbi:MAG: serine/threonine protein phosphatase [Rhodospirillaceae bacterium]|nr:serine/threonine protein phosphatase [Rhodospirillaceae bacterium]
MPIAGKHLFTFAVIADTHMNQEEDYSSSPYPCNALANARTRRVVAELNQLKPEFVVHLGDIVNPVPELPTYEAAAGHFKALVADLEAPLHLVSGNHDVGDKPVSWMPAGTVNDEHLALYEQHFGDHYYSFDANSLHMVVINAQIINSGLQAEEDQRVWLEKDLADNAAKRTFICIHYPPYVSNEGENGTYDNIDEPGRSWLTDLIKTHKPEGMFCGHVHNFWYDLLGDTEMYILPSTAFVRQDYSEMYRIEPGDQYGRNDEPKLGYFMVRVYEQGHVVENIRTYGRTLDDGATLPAPPARVHVPQSKESSVVDVGLDMRHAWAEELVVAPSGGVDEFERKLARNDYPVSAMWEMGMKRMRVPIQDLLDTKTRRRMAIMQGAGHLFQVHSYGIPGAEARKLLVENVDLVYRLEIVINWEKADERIGEIAALKAETGLPVYLSRVNRKHTAKHTGGRYNHLISHGFVLDEADELAAFFDANEHAAAIDGVMFSVMRDVEPATAAMEAQAFAERLGRTACLYVKSSTGSPWEAFMIELANTNRFAETVVCGLGVAGVETYLDTFDDIERSYFARVGLVDRRFNPKMGSRVVGNLFGLLGGGDWTLQGDAVEAGGARVLTIQGDGETQLLVLPPENGEALEAVLSGQSCSQAVDLDSGEISAPPALITTPTVLWVG